MARSVAYGASFALGAITLQGCGGGGGGSGETTTTTTTTTTVTLPVGPTGLHWCEDMGTFYKVHYDDATKSATGQCLPSQVPGAYYTAPGQKGDDGKSDRDWMCFSPDFEKDLWTNEAAQEQDPPFAGACLFRDFYSKTTPAQVPDCGEHLPHHPAKCSPGPSAYWGACWSSRSENWRCIPQGDATIPGLAKGDCKASVLLEDDSTSPTPYFYDGACRFGAEKLTLYKCDTVHGYSGSNAGTCGQRVDQQGTDKACFSLKHGMQWRCIPGTQKDFDTPCDWTLEGQGSGDFYRGSCVFPNNKMYKHALDAHNLTSMSSDGIIV